MINCATSVGDESFTPCGGTALRPHPSVPPHPPTPTLADEGMASSLLPTGDGKCRQYRVVVLVLTVLEVDVVVAAVLAAAEVVVVVVDGDCSALRAR